MLAAEARVQGTALGIRAVQVGHMVFLALIAVTAIHADGTHVGVRWVDRVVAAHWNWASIRVVQWAIGVGISSWNGRVGADVAHRDAAITAALELEIMVGRAGSVTTASRVILIELESGVLVLVEVLAGVGGLVL